MRCRATTCILLRNKSQCRSRKHAIRMSLMRILLSFCIVFLKVYRWFVSPLFQSLGVQCRFIPSCSEFALEAIRVHGEKGILLAMGRVCRCHPFCTGGEDPVPR